MLHLGRVGTRAGVPLFHLGIRARGTTCRLEFHSRTRNHGFGTRVRMLSESELYYKYSSKVSLLDLLNIGVLRILRSGSSRILLNLV